MNYDYNHEGYGHYTRRNGVDFREGAYKCLPDAGAQFMRERMRDMDFRCFQDFRHKERKEITRWWFKDEQTVQARLQGIQSMGYEACGPITRS